MSEYIPSTEAVRRAYVYETPVETPAGWDEAANEAEFNRWLAQNNAEVAKATEERIIKLLETEFCEPEFNGDSFTPADNVLVNLGLAIELIKRENK